MIFLFFFADAAGRDSDGCWCVGTSMEGSIGAPSSVAVVICFVVFFFHFDLLMLCRKNVDGGGGGENWKRETLRPDPKAWRFVEKALLA